MKVLALDVGATQTRTALVETEEGKVLDSSKNEDSFQFKTNSDMADFIEARLKQYGSDVSGIGLCLTGPVDEDFLIGRGGPNSIIKGELTFPKLLKDRGYEIVALNDLRAAAMGTATYGEGKGRKNVCIATYSSGFGAAIVREGKLVTHAEIGHMPYKNDSALFCGCGGRGHLEIYVSGNGAAVMAQQYFRSTQERDHMILRLAAARTNISIDDVTKDDDLWVKLVSKINGKDVYGASNIDRRDDPQSTIRNMQEEAIAYSFGLMISAFNPLDVIVYMGSLALKNTALMGSAIDHYHDGKKDHQLNSLNVPNIVPTKLGDDIGFLGAAAYFAQKQGGK